MNVGLATGGKTGKEKNPCPHALSLQEGAATPNTDGTGRQPAANSGMLATLQSRSAYSASTRRSHPPVTKPTDTGSVT